MMALILDCIFYSWTISKECTKKFNNMFTAAQIHIDWLIGCLVFKANFSLKFI